MYLRKFVSGAALLALSAAAYANVNPATGKTIVLVTSDIAANTTWLASNEYVLQGSDTNQGAIRVLPGATLTVQAGTIIRGQPKSVAAYNPGSLVVLRGAKIVANGSAGSPIIFTSAALDNNADGVADGFNRVGVPGGTSPAPVVTADRYVDDASFVGFWDANPSASPKAYTKSGLWGGLIILGNSQCNEAYTPGDDAVDPTLTGTPDNRTTYAYGAPLIEGFTSPDYEYGHDWLTSDTLPAGTGAYTKTGKIDVDDSSGELSYLSLRHGGAQLSPDNEINGLTLGGVGRGTYIDYIEVWGNEDDGIEIFGGTVNLKHIAIFGTKDDGLDIDQGYQGQVQYGLIVGGSYMEKLLEWDGDDASGDAGRAAKANGEPRASFEVRNLTLVSLASQNPSTSAGQGLDGRRNASFKLYNSIFVYGTSFGGPANATPSAWKTPTTYWNALGAITRFGSTIPGVTTGTNSQTFGTLSTGNPGFGTISSVVDPTTWPTDIAGQQYLSALNPRPGNSGGSAAAYLFPVAALKAQLGFFEQTTYRGAFSNLSAAPLWTNGWTAANISGAIPTL